MIERLPARWAGMHHSNHPKRPPAAAAMARAVKAKCAHPRPSAAALFLGGLLCAVY